MSVRPGRWRSWPRRGDAGSAAVELAMAMPAIVLVLGLIAGVAAWGQKAVLAEYAVAVAARTALVEGAAAGAAAGRTVAEEATVSVTEVDGVITATVEFAARGPVPPVRAAVQIPSQP